MSALIKVNPKLPAAIQRLVALATPETFNELSGGVTSGFPIISYKGKVWRIRKGGEEELHVDNQQNALPTIDVVLVQANPHPSKIFYDKKFEEGSNESPRCFSNDGLKPDVSVQEPYSSVCASCPNNVWGSRITDNGKKSRACSDARRMAVVFANDLLDNGADCMKLLLRVPPASLNPLKDYAEKVLAPKGIPFFGIVTRIGFDVNAAHPQFTFKASRFLNDDEAEVITSLRNGDDVKRILAEAQEFPAGAAASDDEPASQASSAAAPATGTPAAVTTAPAAKPSKMRAATEEEAGAAVAPTPAAKPKPAPPSDEIAAAPAPRKAKKSATPAPVVATPETDDDDEPPTPSPARASSTAGDFENLLDTILNG